MLRLGVYPCVGDSGCNGSDGLVPGITILIYLVNCLVWLAFFFISVVFLYVSFLSVLFYPYKKQYRNRTYLRRPNSVMSSRRLRAFKRWMRCQGVEYSDAHDFRDDPEQGISVIALSDLKEGDLVAAIPKNACLTVKTSGASEVIESAGLGGCLGLAFALVHEKSLGEDSPWAGYLQLLPEQECVPCVWSIEEVDSLLRGTELHKIVKEDKGLVFQDWKENILPLLDSAEVKLNPDYFGVEQYFAAKILVASRSFEIDDYHGYGMVPLADLFNHKTGSEDVHFTAVTSHSESDSDADSDDHAHSNSDGYGPSTEYSHLDREEPVASPNGKNSPGGSDLDSRFWKTTLQ